MAGAWVADRRLWLTADRGRLVPDGHPEAAFLFCTVGTAVPAEEARRFGLMDEAKAAAPPDNKAEAPPPNKAARPYRRRNGS